MKNLFVVPLLIILLLFSIQPAFSQGSTEIDAIKEEIKALKQGQEAIQKDIADMKKQLTARPSPAAFKEMIFSVENDPYKGSKDAKLALIEISEYQCPFCGRHVRETIPQIMKDYIETGKIRYYFIDFPLGFHKQAFKAAEAVACAGDQNKFWEMHDKLFENQKALNPEDLIQHAEAIGLEMPKFKECLDSGKHADEINKDIAEAKKAGVSGTPSSLLGWMQDDGKSVKAVKIVKGAQPYAAFKEAIESLLAPKK